MYVCIYIYIYIYIDICIYSTDQINMVSVFTDFFGGKKATG